MSERRDVELTAEPLVSFRGKVVGRGDLGAILIREYDTFKRSCICAMTRCRSRADGGVRRWSSGGGLAGQPVAVGVRPVNDRVPAGVQVGEQVHAALGVDPVPMWYPSFRRLTGLVLQHDHTPRTEDIP